MVDEDGTDLVVNDIEGEDTNGVDVLLVTPSSKPPVVTEG